MNGELVIYEAGLLIDGKYSPSCSSEHESDVDDIIEEMKTSKPNNSKITKFKRIYQLVSSTEIALGKN